MDKSTQEENFSQRLQANSKQFKKVVTSLTGYNGNLMLQIQAISFIL